MHITNISATTANTILQDGGMHWILFFGDDFDDSLYEEWSGKPVSDDDISRVIDAISGISPDGAIMITE